MTITSKKERNLNMEKTQEQFRKNGTIIIRSENCNELLDERKRASDKALEIGRISVSLVVGGVFFLPYLIAHLEDKELSQVEGVSPPVALLLIVAWIVVLVLAYKEGRREQELHNKYKQYCSTEVLVASDNKIYGSTTKGALELSYNQIESVRFAPNVWSPTKKTPIVPNDIFAVRDIAGNDFIFYSFKNCKELKAVIDMQIRRVRDDKVQ